MSFRLWTIFYVFAIAASGMAIFGLAGIPVAIVILGFWAHRRSLGYNALRLRFAVGYVLLLVGFCWLIVPAIPAARETEKRLQCVNNIKQLALATLNYINTRKGFPAAQVADANGKPMHSWRVMITPYLCASPFFDRYKQNEPWNGPTNRTLAGMGFCASSTNALANRRVQMLTRLKRTTLP